MRQLMGIIRCVCARARACARIRVCGRACVCPPPHLAPAPMFVALRLSAHGRGFLWCVSSRRPVLPRKLVHCLLSRFPLARMGARTSRLPRTSRVFVALQPLCAVTTCSFSTPGVNTKQALLLRDPARPRGAAAVPHPGEPRGLPRAGQGGGGVRVVELEPPRRRRGTWRHVFFAHGMTSRLSGTYHFFKGGSSGCAPWL